MMTATVAHRCALCSEPLKFIDDDDLYEWAAERHHAVCPKRPIEVGDEVEWSRVGRDLRIIGRLVEIAEDKSHVFIEVREQHGKWPYEMVGNRQRCDGPLHKSVTLRRIPRPAEARAITIGIPGDDMSAPVVVAADPLDVEYDGTTLRELMRLDELARTTTIMEGPARVLPRQLTPAQRAAVSAHWSAALRARVAADREAERNRVRIDLEVEPWE